MVSDAAHDSYRCLSTQIPQTRASSLRKEHILKNPTTPKLPLSATGGEGVWYPLSSARDKSSRERDCSHSRVPSLKTLAEWTAVELIDDVHAPRKRRVSSTNTHTQCLQGADLVHTLQYPHAFKIPPYTPSITTDLPRPISARQAPRPKVSPTPLLAPHTARPSFGRKSSPSCQESQDHMAEYIDAEGASTKMALFTHSDTDQLSNTSPSTARDTMASGASPCGDPRHPGLVWNQEPDTAREEIRETELERMRRIRSHAVFAKLQQVRVSACLCWVRIRVFVRVCTMFVG